MKSLTNLTLNCSLRLATGTWEGTGTMWYEGQENTLRSDHYFEQDGLPFIEYRAESFLLDDEGQKLRPITVETGFAD